MRTRRLFIKSKLALMLLLLVAGSFVTLSSVAPASVSAAGVCQKQYNAWDKDGKKSDGDARKKLDSCIDDVAGNYCVSSHVETKKARCIDAYEDGFFSHGTCDSKDGKDKTACTVGDNSREVYADAAADGDDGDSAAAPVSPKGTSTKYKCGGGDAGSVMTAINFGCKGKGNSLVDLLFAIIRFLSNGVGLVIIGSLIWGGIQYTMSRGDPQAVAAATNRFQAVFAALLIYMFTYAIVNYLIPGQLLK